MPPPLPPPKRFRAYLRAYWLVLIVGFGAVAFLLLPNTRPTGWRGALYDLNPEAYTVITYCFVGFGLLLILAGLIFGLIESFRWPRAADRRFIVREMITPPKRASLDPTVSDPVDSKGNRDDTVNVQADVRGN